MCLYCAQWTRIDVVKDGQMLERALGQVKEVGAAGGIYIHLIRPPNIDGVDAYEESWHTAQYWVPVYVGSSDNLRRRLRNYMNIDRTFGDQREVSILYVQGPCYANHVRDSTAGLCTHSQSQPVTGIQRSQ